VGIEFFFCHSGVFFAFLLYDIDVPGRKAPSKETVRFKWGMLAFLGLVYMVFVWSLAGHLLLLYILLTMGRVSGALGGGSSMVEEVGRAMARITIYVGALVVIALAELSFGVSPTESGLEIVAVGGEISPHQFLMWGFLFYLICGVAGPFYSLVRKRCSIASTDSGKEEGAQQK
jgi:hypothetical protein